MDDPALASTQSAWGEENIGLQGLQDRTLCWQSPGGLGVPGAGVGKPTGDRPGGRTTVKPFGPVTFVTPVLNVKTTQHKNAAISTVYTATRKPRHRHCHRACCITGRHPQLLLHGVLKQEAVRWVFHVHCCARQGSLNQPATGPLRHSQLNCKGHDVPNFGRGLPRNMDGGIFTAWWWWWWWARWWWARWWRRWCSLHMRHARRKSRHGRTSCHMQAL